MGCVPGNNNLLQLFIVLIYFLQIFIIFDNFLIVFFIIFGNILNNFLSFLLTQPIKYGAC